MKCLSFKKMRSIEVGICKGSVRMRTAQNLGGSNGGRDFIKFIYAPCLYILKWWFHHQNGCSIK